MAKRVHVSSQAEIEAEIYAAVRRQAELGIEADKFADRVCEVVKSHTPVDTGKTRASIHVEKPRTRANGLPWRRVISRYWKMHLIEFGTGPDDPDSKSPFGPDTPTPAFAPFEKAAHEFGGTMDGVSR
ncbi:hypothetical protein MSP7336_01802 [Mycobacterium shimoidei]|uniref:HK97 gp10 family phage protein n=1 Tax=Mycobacterium shimoidei TaxID=29313 RepID=A0A375YXC2_MYCSH|nr:HK97 gp10 family phage protein [Mycobacterium shimoidei]SRX93563.1 hypothetical protein MSP7336_01802 [Mycobacterium shimoidei]